MERIGGVLISVSVVVERVCAYVDKPLKSVPNGQCDARPTVTFGRYQIILLGDRGAWVLATFAELLPA